MFNIFKECFYKKNIFKFNNIKNLINFNEIIIRIRININNVIAIGGIKY